MTWYLYSLLAALALTSAVLLEKKNLTHCHSLEFSTETSFYGLVFSLFLLPWVRWDYDLPTYGLVILQGIVSMTAFLLFTRSLKHTDVSEFSPLTNLDTVATVIFAFFLLSDLPSAMQLIGIFFIIFGAYLLEIRPGGGYLAPFAAFSHSKYLVMLLGSMTLYGLNKAIGKLILFKMSPISALFFIYVTYTVGYLVLDLVFHRENITKLRQLLKAHGTQIFSASLAFFFYRLTMTYAMALGSVSLATAVTRTSTFFTALAGGKLFFEHGLKRRLLASVVIIGGALLIVLKI